MAAALYHVLERPAWAEFGAAAALGGSEFLDLRVEQLELGREPPLAPVPRWASAVTVGGLGLLSGAFLLSARTVGDGGITMMGDAPDRGDPLLGGAASALLGVLGGVMCALAWVGIALVVLRHGLGDNRLTLRSSHSTNRQ